MFSHSLFSILWIFVNYKCNTLSASEKQNKLLLMFDKEGNEMNLYIDFKFRISMTTSNK